MNKLVWLSVFAFSVILVSCAKDDPVVAKVGKSTILASQVRDRLASLSYPQQDQYNQKQIVEEMVREAVLIELAKQVGIDKQKSYKQSVEGFKREQERQFEEFKNSLLIEYALQEFQSEVVISDAEIDAYYQIHKEDFDAPTAYVVKHVLTYDRQSAETAYDAIKSGQPFEQVVRQYSQDISSFENGGTIGPFKKGEVIAEFENAALALSPGEVSQIVETPLGFHIIYKVSQSRMPPMTVQEAQPEIRKFLEQEKFDTWYERKKQELKVKVNYSVPLLNTN
ncbi:MAG: peptidylprolyl isomerase [Elusimicrobiota bacterium]|jgi:parvulin-like peptidyl-prolyl isomerase|nr:peptidylprolyl isomerase [Elusimicrobiota bacterium]